MLLSGIVPALAVPHPILHALHVWQTISRDDSRGGVHSPLGNYTDLGALVVFRQAVSPHHVLTIKANSRLTASHLLDRNKLLGPAATKHSLGSVLSYFNIASLIMHKIGIFLGKSKLIVNGRFFCFLAYFCSTS